jgi:acetolactate synthase-1/2/3 large subunit
MDVNESIVIILEQIGVDHVFGGSGQVNASMLLALERSKQIKTVIVRNEQAASFMACGYAMFSDRLGVCFATGGPGAFNLFSGMAVAYSDSLPVLAITGYTSSEIRGKGALNESTGLSRTPDSHKMFAATTKKSYILENADEVYNVFEAAINIAFEGRPGPVHIHIPKDITTTPVQSFRQIKLDIKPVLPDGEKINKFAKVLGEAIVEKQQIVVLIGYGAVRSHAQQVLLDFVERFQIPFMTTMDAKGILAENHPLSLGVFGASGDPGANCYFEGSRVVLALGNSFAENATFGFEKDLFDGKILMQINIDSHEINKVFLARYAMISEITPAIQEISNELAKNVGTPLKRQVARDKFYDRQIENGSDKIHPGELVKAISRNLPANSIILGDAGAHMLWLNCYLNLDQNQHYQNPGSFGPMASHVNGALGVKCANRDRTVVSACGDGGYLMAGFELLTAVQYQIPVIWIIFNNGEFNIIKKFLLERYERYAYMKFDNPDYVKYAEACGAQGFRAETVAQFERVFTKALSLKQPVLIDAVVDSMLYPPLLRNLHKTT